MAVVSVGAVVLGPAHDVVECVVHVNGQALVLQRSQIPVFIVEIVVGTLDSQLLQSIRSLPDKPRDADSLCTSLNDPSNLHIPPSLPITTMFGLNGVAAIAC